MNKVIWEGPMSDDIVGEIKCLNQMIVKRLFSLKKGQDLEDYHPRPLQISIVDFLSHQEGCQANQKEIEKHLKISKAALSDALKAMERHGMIERIHSISDGRANIIVLTKRTSELHDEYMHDKNIINQEIIESLSQEEVLLFKKVLLKMIKRMEDLNV